MSKLRAIKVDTTYAGFGYGKSHDVAMTETGIPRWDLMIL
jgi:hypothetical protein